MNCYLTSNFSHCVLCDAAVNTRLGGPVGQILCFSRSKVEVKCKIMDLNRKINKTKKYRISSRGSGIRDQQRFHNRLQHARSSKDDNCIHIIACNIRSFSCSLTTDPCEVLQNILLFLLILSRRAELLQKITFFKKTALS